MCVYIYSDNIQDHQANSSFNRFFYLISSLSKAKKCEGLWSIYLCRSKLSVPQNEILLCDKMGRWGINIRIELTCLLLHFILIVGELKKKVLLLVIISDLHIFLISLSTFHFMLLPSWKLFSILLPKIHRIRKTRSR